MAAILRLGADPADVRRAFGSVGADARKLNRQLNTDARAAAADRTKTLRQEQAEQIRSANVSMRARQRAERDATKSAEDGHRTRLRLIGTEGQAVVRASAEQSRARERAERLATQVAQRESLARIRQARAEARQTAAEIRSGRQGQIRGAEGRIESRNNARTTERRVTGTVAVGGAMAINAIGRHGDEVRGQQQRQEALEQQAAQTAQDSGSPGARREILAAVQRTATASGIAPEAVMGGVNAAQSDFSALQNAGDRASYLSTVLPELARVAVATNSPLEDVVRTAGELQRQLGISNTELPDALAQVVVQGRQGSIAFKDMAQHMGVLGGASSRFLATGGAAGMRSSATTGALFQFAGRAGGGGDEAATRANTFLNNFTSSRGQNRLSRVLGHSVLDARGQLRTNEGETQSAAFERIVEETYARTGGNATRFRTAIAGTESRSQVVGDQLYKDLQAHGGRLTGFHGLVSDVTSATAANTQGAAFADISQTDAVKRAQQANRMFYNLGGDEGKFARQTDTQLRGFRENHSFLGGILDNEMGRGAMDAMNEAMNWMDPSSQIRRDAPVTTRRESIMANGARDIAAREYGEQTPWALQLMDKFTGRGTQQIDARAYGIAGQMGERAGMTQRQLDVTLSAASIAALAAAFHATPITATVSAHDAAHAANEASLPRAAPL